MLYCCHLVFVLLSNISFCLVYFCVFSLLFSFVFSVHSYLCRASGNSVILLVAALSQHLSWLSLRWELKKSCKFTQFSSIYARSFYLWFCTSHFRKFICFMENSFLNTYCRNFLKNSVNFLSSQTAKELSSVWWLISQVEFFFGIQNIFFFFRIKI